MEAEDDIKANTGNCSVLGGENRLKWWWENKPTRRGPVVGDTERGAPLCIDNSLVSR